MKKLKFLPTILMLVLCVGILAIGIYAVKPTENNISGSITVNASNAAVKLELLKGDTVVQTFESVRSGATFNKIDLEFDVETANVVSDVERVSYSVRITNLSSTPLGAYFFNETTTLPTDGIATATNILKEDTINTTEETPRPLANVLLSGYTFVPAAATDPANTVPVQLTATMALNQLFDMTVTGDFDYVLNIEPYQTNLTGTLTENTSHSDALLKLPIPTGSATIIPGSIFSGNTLITDVVVPYGYTEVESHAFSRTSIERISLPTSITIIGLAAFNNCSSLTAIEIPGSIDQMGFAVFDGCIALTFVDLSACTNLTCVEDYLFQNCSSLFSIKLASGLTYIGDSAFNGCSSLTSIEIPSSVTSISTNAFSSCSSLTSIEIPSGVTGIGGSAFEGCSKLATITVKAGTATTFGCCLPYDGFKLNGTTACTTSTAIARVAEGDNVYTRTVA